MNKHIEVEVKKAEVETPRFSVPPWYRICQLIAVLVVLAISAYGLSHY